MRREHGHRAHKVSAVGQQKPEAIAFIDVLHPGLNSAHPALGGQVLEKRHQRGTRKGSRLQGQVETERHSTGEIVRVVGEGVAAWAFNQRPRKAFVEVNGGYPIQSFAPKQVRALSKLSSLTLR